jgi:hypothetical protein
MKNFNYNNIYLKLIIKNKKYIKFFFFNSKNQLYIYLISLNISNNISLKLIKKFLYKNDFFFLLLILNKYYYN